MIDNYFEMVAGWQTTPTALGDGYVPSASKRERAASSVPGNHLVTPSPHHSA